MPLVVEAIEEGNWLWEPGEIIVVPLGRPPTVDDLRRTRLKAEIVGRQLIVIGPSGDLAASAAGNILVSLQLHKRRSGGGRAFGSRLAYLLDLPHRQAICPDASWYTGPPAGAGFPRGAPAFAVEIRDPGEQGDRAERRMAAKRADYFAAGTQVVWDVDVLHEGVIRAYRADLPDRAKVYRRGQTAGAEPAVPGWRFAVDALLH